MKKVSLISILIFSKVLTEAEAKGISGLVKGVSYISHHNWERGNPDAFSLSTPTMVVDKVAFIISEFIRRPQYCFITLSGPAKDTSLVKLKETNSYLGLLNDRFLTEPDFLDGVHDEVEDFIGLVHFNDLRSALSLSAKQINEIKNTFHSEELRSIIEAGDLTRLRESIAEQIMRLHQVPFFAEY